MMRSLLHAKLAYTVTEAASLLSLSRSQLYRLMDQGDMAFVKVGRSRRITAAQLEQFTELLNNHQDLKVIQ